MENIMDTSQDWQLNQICIKDRFRELLFHSKWTDCSFRVGEKNVEIIHAHKLVLAVSSPVFEALFYGLLANPDNTVIDIPDIEPHIFKIFMRYIYSDVIDLQTIDEAGGVLYIAKKYLLYELESRCISYLVSHTWIKTLWDILAIAELLNDNDLFKSCFKIMCRFSYDIWGSDEEHFSGSTLCRLMDETGMNMPEFELWTVIFDWAKKECQVNGEGETPTNIRLSMEKVGALSKVRFLTLNNLELNAIIETGILSEDEITMLKNGIAPQGFAKETEPRRRLASLTWRCSREFILKNQTWFSKGAVVSHISSSSRALITGFEIFTRIYALTEYMKTCMDYFYREKFVLFIKDSQGKILSKIDHDSDVEFNKTQTICLSRPIWFEPRVKYTIQISELRGVYPLSKFRDSTSRGTTFEFDDITYIDETTSLPSSGFILTVLYAL